MHTNIGKERTIKTKPSQVLRDVLNTSYSVKGTQFKKTKHTWQRSDTKRNFSED